MAQFIGHINPKNTVHIIGGGISGLLIAYFLKKKKIPFILYEKEPRVGGLIKTIRTDYGLVETAANALFTNDDVIELLRELKLEYIPSTEKIRRILVRKKAFLSFPFYFWEIPGLLWRFFLVKPPHKKGLTLKELLLPLLGERLCDEVVSTGLQGIYATDSSVLDQESFFACRPYKSYRHLLKDFVRGRKQSRAKYNVKTSVSFKGGMQDFINALEKEVKENIVHQNMTELPRNSILCTNASSAQKLLQFTHPEVSQLLQKITYQSICTQTSFTEEEYGPLHHSFGVLFSRQSPIHSFGILANHEIFKGRSGKGFSYTFIKKAFTNAASEDEDNQVEIDEDCQRLSFPMVKERHATIWGQGIPIYSVERRGIMDEVKKYFTNQSINDLAIFGNYVDGISMRELITMAKNFTENL